jgi:hypothetical protein
VARGVSLLALVCSIALGCGYSLVRYQGGLGDVRSVAVDTPRNDSTEPGLEFIVADALRREILRRRGARLVEDPERADLVLSGRVLPIRVTSRSFSSVVQSLEYEVTLALDLQAARSDGSVLEIDSRALRESERYLASADAEAMLKNRQEALRRAAKLLAGRVYDALYESLVR